MDKMLNHYQNSHVGRKRASNEDFIDFKNYGENSIFLVCDGMGGKVGGQKASELAAKSIIHFFNNDDFCSPLESINNALSNANNKIYNYALKYHSNHVRSHVSYIFYLNPQYIHLSDLTF